MPAELPIACSLSAAELSVRLAEIADLGRAALLEVHAEGTRAELRFAGESDVRERIDAIVAAESICCAFLTMRVSDAPPDVVLSVEAPQGAAIAVRQLIDAFRGEPPATR